MLKLIFLCASPASSISFVKIMFAFPHVSPTFISVYHLFSHELNFLLKKNTKQNTSLGSSLILPALVSQWALSGCVLEG